MIIMIHLVDFVLPSHDRAKIIESEKRNKYMDLAQEQRKLYNMRVAVIPIVGGAYGMVPKIWEK